MMTTDEQIIFWQKLEAEGVGEVRLKFANGNYGARKKREVEEWLRHKEAGDDAPTYMYHPQEAIAGQVYPSYFVPLLMRKGWIDTPAKFGQRKPITHLIDAVRKWITYFWLDHWKWILMTVVAIAAIYYGIR